MAPELRGRILQYYEYRFPDRAFYDVEYLISQLPRSIQETLAVHVHQDLIKKCLILERCSASTLSDVCLRFRPFYAARGDVIVHATSVPDGIYFIRSGKAMVMKGGFMVTTIKPGDVFGENCLVDPSTGLNPVRLSCFYFLFARPFFSR